MASKQPDWLLKVIERQEEAVEELGGKPYRGELLYKGETQWIVEADTERQLEAEARDYKRIAIQHLGIEDDDDPDAELVTFIILDW